MRTPADALRDPRPGDVVMAIADENCPDVTFLPKTCQARIGDCVAYTTGTASTVHWELIWQWGGLVGMIKSYEVVHVAQEGGEG